MLTSRPRRGGAIARVASALLVAAALAAPLALTPSTAAHADDTIGVSGSPASSGAADGRTRFSYQVAPGQHLEDDYLVRNTGTSTQTMTVFGTDAFNTADGSWGLLPTDVRPKDSGSWVTFDGKPSATVTLPAKGEQLVHFAVDVPADARPGDHAGGLVVSALSPEGQVLVDRRVATRLYVRVPGDIQAALTVSSMSSHYVYSWNPFDGEVVVDLTVRNTGNVALGGLAVVNTRTWFGFGLTRVARPDFPELLPGNVRTMRVTLTGIPALGYLEPHISLAPTVSPDAIQPPAFVTTERSTTTLAMPWLALGILVVALGAFAISRLRRRLDARRAAEWMAYVEQQAARDAADGELVGAGRGADRTGERS